jgi:hypothetical protein
MAKNRDCVILARLLLDRDREFKRRRAMAKMETIFSAATWVLMNAFVVVLAIGPLTAAALA